MTDFFDDDDCDANYSENEIKNDDLMIEFDDQRDLEYPQEEDTQNNLSNSDKELILNLKKYLTKPSNESDQKFDLTYPNRTAKNYTIY